MWRYIANFIIQYKFPLLFLVLVLTTFMAYKGRNVEIDYQFAPIIPKEDSRYIENKEFRERFGEDANLMIVGLQSDVFFEQEMFGDWYEMGNRMKEIEGVAAIISPAHTSILVKDTVNKRFEVKSILTKRPDNQQVVDSLRKLIFSMPFYEGLLYTSSKDFFLMGITIDDKFLNNKSRDELIAKVLVQAKTFEDKHQAKLRYSGLPYMRSFTTTVVQKELKVFLIFSVLIAVLIIWVLFRSFKIVCISLFLMLSGIVWVVGWIGFFGLKINILTGLIPPLIVVISVPNCVYMMNRFFWELEEHGDKNRALRSTTRRIGEVIFYANLTTAIGFSVFSFIKSAMLREFGLIAGLSISVLFIMTMILIPTFLSLVSLTKKKYTENKGNELARKFLAKLSDWVYYRRKAIRWSGFLIFLFSLVMVTQLEEKSYIFDVLSEDSQEFKDYKFFEQNLGGVLPLELVVDAKKKNSITKSTTLKKLEQVEAIFTKDSIFSKPLSVVDGFKMVTQAFYNGNPNYYRLPSNLDKNFVFSYLAKTERGEGRNLIESVTDSTGQYARISVQMVDVGSHKMQAVIDSLKSKIEKILPIDKYRVSYTGTSVVALAGYDYLIKGLINSVLIAFLLISLVIAFLFRSTKMLIIALIPNIIPLLFTAAMMAMLGISLNPSTVLIFSVAFGISVDFTIHFLVKYRLEMEYFEEDVVKAVSASIQETGLSMLYTAFILFFGFVIFTGSEFKGTFYLGLLTSMTIVVAIFANLVLLPTILIYFRDKNTDLPDGTDK
ncbi:MAG: MMPL family transporter [Chitinophagales bacterium]